MENLNIGDKLIGCNQPVFFIAELSANHNQNFDLAIRTIKAMKKAGADAVKVQTFSGDTLTIDCKKEDFQIRNGTLWDGMTLYDLYQSAMMPWDWHEPLKKLTEDLGMVFFSTPTDHFSADFLEKIGVPAFKISSFEISDIPLIKYIAKKGKPLILSTGIAEFEMIKDAIETCRNSNNDQIVVLKCTSDYPTSWEDVNLNAITTLREKFSCIVGISDHTMGEIVPLGAVALGARIIEKHFILDRSVGGLDSSFSMEPKEFRNMVNKVRLMEKILGKNDFIIPKNVEKNRQFARSLYVVKDIKKGETFTDKNIRSIRPGFGLKPIFYFDIIGKSAKCDIERGTRLTWDLISK